VSKLKLHLASQLQMSNVGGDTNTLQCLLGSRASAQTACIGPEATKCGGMFRIIARFIGLVSHIGTYDYIVCLIWLRPFQLRMTSFCSMVLDLLIENCLTLRFIIVLSMNSGVENQAELVEESIQHAKEAITLDVKDGNSWCKLSNKLLP